MIRRTFLIAVLFSLIAPLHALAQESRLFGYVSIRNAKVTTTALQSDSKMALLGFDSGQITVFDPLPGKFLRFDPFNAHDKQVTAAVFRHDDKWFATGGIDGHVKLWETAIAVKFQKDNLNRKDGAPKLAPPEAKHTLKEAHPGGVSSLAFSPDGKRLATAGADGSAKIWDVETLKLLANMEAHKGGVNAIAFAPDGESVATAGADKTFKIWKVAVPEKPVFVSPEHQGPVLALAYSPDGKNIVSGSGEPKKSGQVQVWDVGKGKLSQVFGELADVVTTLSYHPRLPRIASGGRDKKVRVWSLTLKKQLYEDDHLEALIKVLYSADGNVLGAISPVEGKWWNGSPKVK